MNHVPRKSYVVLSGGKKQIVFCAICQKILEEKDKKAECEGAK